MAKKISQLDPLDLLTGHEEIPVSYNGNNFKVKTSELVSQISKSALGLDKVDNTPDADKPISTATAAAIATLATKDELTTVVSSIETKADIDHKHVIDDVDGLESALAGKSDVEHRHAVEDVEGLPEALQLLNTGYSTVTQNIDGLRTDVDLLIRSFESLPTEFEISTITGLQQELDNKANVSHTHDAGDITNIDVYVDNRIAARTSLPVVTSEW